MTARPELLAPAGDPDCVRAAIENGADAIYFGLATSFNARARAANHPAESLPGLMAELHRRGVRGYVTLNTLIFPGELPRVEQTLRTIAAAGADAVVVQDLGVVRLARELCPDLPIHASTQMSLTSAEGIGVAESLGVSRVVLARELSIAEIRTIRGQTQLPLEVFVHGALCVAYSGQCLTSESLGGRSANRGQCAQACRTSYTAICDGQALDLGDQKYLLSPQDLAAYDLVPELIAAGVDALKIEGRMKSAEYVANITRHYRRAIDAALAGQPIEFSPEQIEEMEISFSRGFSHGWLQGCNHKELVPGRNSAKRGVLLGQVIEVRKGRVAIQLASSVKRGDGILFEGDREHHADQGGRVYEVFRQGQSLKEPVQGGSVELTFGHGAIDFQQVRPGQQVWKTDDPALARRLRKTFASAGPKRRVPLDLVIEAAPGRALQIAAQAESGACCRLQSPQVLEAAIRHPLTAEVLQEHLGRLGGTAYQLRRLKAKIEGSPMVPLSVLGALRHELVRQLDAAGAQSAPRRIAAESALAALRATIPAVVAGLPTEPLLSAVRRGSPDPAETSDRPAAQLHVLCRRLDQIEPTTACGVRSLIADFHDIRQYGDAVQAAHATGAKILLAAPRIHKPGEMGLLKALIRHGGDGILVRNLASLAFFGQEGVPTVADFSLNAANELTVQFLRDRGARRVTVSYDMNRDQLLDLVVAVPPEWLEVVIHQHMPMFHMEHCVFCGVLSPGTNKTNCGRPCDRHEVRLRDRIGMEHALEADAGCRNTLYNAVPQSAAEVVTTLRDRGVRHFRIEFSSQASDSQLRQTIGLYADLLAGRITGRDVWIRLKASHPLGVTRGTLENR